MAAFFNFRKSYFVISFTSLIILAMGEGLGGCGTKTKDSNNKTTDDPKSLAMLYLTENRLDEAVTAFQQAIKIQPEDTSNYIGLTRLYLLQKNYDAAEKTDKAGLRIAPDNIDLKLLLAEIYDLKNEKGNAERELNEILKKNPKNVSAYFKLAELDTSLLSIEVRKFYLLKVQSLLPANIVPRIHLAELFARIGKTDSSLFYLQSIKKIAPGFSDAAETTYQKATSLLHANQPVNALVYIQRFHALMKITPEYASGSDEIEIPKMVAGYFNFDTNIPVSATGNSAPKHATENSLANPLLTFKDLSEIPGSTNVNISKAENTVLALADYDAEANMYLYSSYLTPGSTASKSYLSVMKMGTFKACIVKGKIDHTGKDLDASFADYDNNGYQDLFIATTNGIVVFKNEGDGTFSRLTENIGLDKTGMVRKMMLADFDQDGDIDMYVAESGGNQFFRNNGDGSFTENALSMGLSGNAHGTLKMDFGDCDDDGDLDIVCLAEDGRIELYNNNRRSNFKDISESEGLKNSKYTGSAIALCDYNNDGRLDVLIAGGAGGKCFLFRNESGHYIVDEKVSEQLSSSLMGIQVYDIAFVDYDNDGHQDLVVAGVNENSSKRGVKLFHNDGSKGLSDVSALLPISMMQAHRIAIADFNFDGDRDLFFSGPSGVRLARNDGGNYNNYVQVQLTGLSFGNGKNNRLGIGARIELKSGDLFQLKTVKGPLTEFGVGTRTKLDALRIIWPNGVPQTIIDPTRKERLLEEAKLKGSCPFLFTWNGKKFEFLKDMLWRSALGIPVAIHGKDTTFAYSNPSKEYLLIPGDKLQPQNGLYTIKITEELWEAVYFDKAALLAVDHPDSVDVFVDERFVAPPYPGRKLYLVSHRQLPVSAMDGIGNNLLPKISKYDFQYVSNFSPGKFQGLANAHDLILDLGKHSNGDSLLLFLRGWVFPTDASINTALSQSKKSQIHPPSLQVINKDGNWQTVIKDIGYPMGRDKMVIVNLTGKFLSSNDRRVKISTNMQVYWDHLFFSTGKINAPVITQNLTMVRADLNYRGYSASFNKGGPFGPEWFAYDEITKGQKWRDLTGYYTRYGNVLPLLQHADDQYIIADGGDEITLNFDATHLPTLSKGWKRDFLIYSEGWVKDGDLNTAHGQTVTPLPFHNMPSYPYGKNISYPNDKAHKKYRQQYNTRKVTTDEFRNAIKMGRLDKANK